MDPYPDPGQSKRCPKQEKNLRFHVKKNKDNFEEGVMVFTRAWDPQTMSLQQFVSGNIIFYIFNFLHFGHEKTWIGSESKAGSADPF